MMKRAIPAILLGLALGACGDDGGGGNDPDAREAPDAEESPDAEPPVTCYNEANEETNNATAEATGQTLTASRNVLVCGAIAVHAPDDNGVIDDDLYTFTTDVAT